MSDRVNCDFHFDTFNFHPVRKPARNLISVMQIFLCLRTMNVLHIFVKNVSVNVVANLCYYLYLFQKIQNEGKY